jgi:C_GCAxxG_C_C family probable redox protein
MNNSKTIQQGTKRLFLKLGTCSRLFFYILNREFGYPIETEERAADPLAGGIMQRGHQCGMLWGSALAVGAESFRRHDDRGQAIGVAITATQHLMESFSKRAKSVNCRDITGCDWSSKISMVKYFFSGRFISCFKLAEKWAPEAIQSATEGLSHEQTDLPQLPTSCASEVAKKMGASDEEMVMVAGFAGGLGLSGNACGALSAAIWMNTLAWCGKQIDSNKSPFRNPNATNTLKAFYGATDSKILCHEISGQCFKTIHDHTEFMKNGGCDKLINVLARSYV